MEHKHIDCREYPNAAKCTVMISEDELLEATIQHAVTVRHTRAAQRVAQAVQGNDYGQGGLSLTLTRT